ncbi:hypothetical protein C5167_032564 [Papaver somniferum]|uniref:Essential protein Yae1 N-terminal domain-containing protein n=1 Tax=Papaver somniferum TaxID=3469 RepID=A0A4Y7K9J3_PAPSO|nr:uncharacterized protein LOC113300592 [Papaver somniferum]RZC68678.1 hypothetical protein C5167_032564 [Papaver somniferum]
MMMDNGSDVVDDKWCDDYYTDDASEFHRQERIRLNKLHTVGYHEGLSKGQEAAVQDGFTNGFKESVSVGYNWGLVRGVSSALACLPDGLKEKLVESLEAREKFQMLYTSISSVSEEDALGLYRDEILRNQSKEYPKPAEENSTSETLSNHISRCNRLRGYSEELKVLLQSSAIEVHSAVE